MSSENLKIEVDSLQQSIAMTFPKRVVSTNVDRLKENLLAFSKTPDAKLLEWTKLILNFEQTEFVDSIGLNLIFELIKNAETRDAKVEALLRSRALRLIFYTVRLEKKMDIRFLE